MNDLVKGTAATEPTGWRGTAIAGYALIALTFGFGAVWAAVTDIDRAVVAPGTIAFETSRKLVQHFEGGIVQGIFVREGQTVKEGDVLFRLEGTQARASFDVVRSQLDSSLVLEARLLAERDNLDKIAWPDEVRERAGESIVARAIADQSAQFQERRASLKGQTGILESRIEQLGNEMRGLDIERESTEGQVTFIKEELVGLRELRAKNLVPLSRVLSMERERTRLEGAIGRNIADRSKAENSIGEAKLQIQQIRQKFQEEVAGAILETRQKISELREKAAVATDVLRRSEVLAPRSGVVQALKVVTIGQVIRSGEPLLEIAPDDEKLIVQAQFAPNDIDGVEPGQQAEVRFSALHVRGLPLLMGRLEKVSGDRLMDEATKQPYYLGLISIDTVELPKELRPRLRPGMPAEVIVAAGERTVMTYLISPLRDAMRRSFTEH